MWSKLWQVKPWEARPVGCRSVAQEHEQGLPNLHALSPKTKQSFAVSFPVTTFGGFSKHVVSESEVPGVKNAQGFFHSDDRRVNTALYEVLQTTHHSGSPIQDLCVFSNIFLDLFQIRTGRCWKGYSIPLMIPVLIWNRSKIEFVFQMHPKFWVK